MRPRASKASGPWRADSLPRTRVGPSVRPPLPRWAGDPPLPAARDGGALHRRGPLAPLARGRAAGHRGVGRARRGARRRRRGRAGAGADASTPRFVAAVAERERVTDHDVAAFVDVVQDRIGGTAGQVDPLRAHVVRRGRHRPVRGPHATPPTCWSRPRPRSSSVLKRRALEHRDTAMVGRTHGVHAEPTTFGAKLALWAPAGRP